MKDKYLITITLIALTGLIPFWLSVIYINFSNDFRPPIITIILAIICLPIASIGFFKIIIRTNQIESSSLKE